MLLFKVFYFYVFVCLRWALAVCGTQHHQSPLQPAGSSSLTRGGTWPPLQPAGSSSLTRGGTWPPCTGRSESSPPREAPLPTPTWLGRLFLVKQNLTKRNGGDRFWETQCVSRLKTRPLLGDSAGMAVRGEGDSRRRLKALASLSSGFWRPVS